MPAKRVSKLPASNLVPREDWDFSEVPDSEIVGCCYWEYARESATIRFIAHAHQLRVLYARISSELPKDERLVNHLYVEEELDELSHEAGFDLDSHAERYWATVCPFLPICDLVLRHVTESALPWQELPPDSRAKFALLPSETSQLHGLQPSLLRELEMLWDAHRAPFEEVRGLNLTESDDREDEALYTAGGPVTLPSEGNAPPGQFTAAFTVDFENFADSEIEADFALWLRQHRPKAWEKPRRILPMQKQKGRKETEYSVALRRLGLMRLLHHCTVPGFEKEFPDAWESYKGTRNRFGRELDASRKFFQRLFPFLPESEEPISWERQR